MASRQNPEDVCYICKTVFDPSEDSILKFGKRLTESDISVHHFCLYFLSGLLQRGKNCDIDDENTPDDGIEGENILGFLLDDIRKAVNICRRNTCKYCKKKNAATWCANKKCRCIFHFDCGQQNNVQYKFYGSFEALCADHHDFDYAGKKVPHPQTECSICDQPIGEFDKLKCISDCCNRGWYHRDCMKKTALHQGYSMKCVSCGSPDQEKRKKYIRFLEHCGVFVPKEDASWEREPDAFAEIHNDIVINCGATECQCENGNDFQQKTGQWEINKCITCGGRGIHTGCFDGTLEHGFICQDCHIESEPQEFYVSLISQSQLMDEPIEESQSSQTVANNSARFTRKKRSAYQAKWNSQKRCHEESEWYYVDVEGFMRKKKTFVLLSPDTEVDAEKPMTQEKFYESQKQLRKDRLELFFEREPKIKQKK